MKKPTKENSDIYKKVESCINDYSLFNKDEAIIVAYSGGKDSLLLCNILNKLGYNIKPVAIDIGYNSNWQTAVNNLKKLGIDCLVVNMNYVKQFLPEAESEVKNYFNIVKQVASKQGKIATTICTPCYNAKYIILAALCKKFNINKVVFGHHGTDAVTSLLKSYFMYEDRWTVGHEKFELSNLYKIVDENKKTFSSIEDFNAIIKPKIINLLNQEKISTNEPPRESKKGITLVRPFFYCREEEIKKEVEKLDLIPVVSECSHVYRKQLIETSREYIQFHLVNVSVNDVVFSEIIELIKPSLTKLGEVKFDARKNRNKVLGENYKNDGICEKKL